MTGSKVDDTLRNSTTTLDHPDRCYDYLFGIFEKALQRHRHEHIIKDIDKYGHVNLIGGKGVFAALAKGKGKGNKKGKRKGE